jgi:separase
MPRTSTRARDRHEFIKITTELASLQSLLAFTDNKIPEALFHARRGTKLSYRLWALIERQKGSNESKLQGDFGTEMESVMEGVSAMSIAPPKSSPVTSMTHESLRSSSFWPLVLPLFQLLLCLSKLLSHHGLFAEARYYAEKALKIAQAVDARILQRQAVALLGRYSLCGNRIEHGLKLFDEIAYEDASLSRSIVDVSIQLDLASGFLMAQDRDRETAAFTMASDILQGLQAGALSERNAIAQEGNSDVPSKPKAMTSKAKSGPRPKAPQTKTKPVIKPSIRSPAEVDAKSTSSDLGSESRQCNGHLPILRMEADVLRHQAQSELRRGNIDAAETWLALAKKLPALYLDTLYQSLATAQLLLARGLADMASDPVFSVIADSVISCPSAAFGGRRRSKDISKIPEGETENGVLSRKTKASVGIKGTRRIQASQTQEFVQVLSKSLEELLSSHVLAQRACSSRTTHVLSDVLTKTLVVLNAACPTNSPISVGSGFAVYAMGKML